LKPASISPLIQVSSRSAQRRIISAKARSRVTRKRSARIVLRSDRDRRKPSSGRIARRLGSTQKTSAASRLSDIGNTPIE
jgi:hypothetical protein